VEPEELESEKNRGTLERAQRFERLCYRSLAEGLISLTKAAELLQLPTAEVEIGMKGPVSAHADRSK
jgi:predicted HTH domain antitoxin